MAAPVISLSDVGIEFARNRRRRLRAKDVLLAKARTEMFWALRHVNMTVGEGEHVAIVGPNGSGKSTILRLIAGVLIPDEGTIDVQQSVAPLLDLNTGFARDLSARDNVYLAGVIHGLSRLQIDARLNDIIAFAELEEFVDTPIRHFSSGMRARLGFGIITQLDHPILLVDEALAVGDRRFKKKCIAEINRMRKERTLLFVSHNASQVKSLCHRAILIEQGVVTADGDVESVLRRYRAQSDN